MNLPRPWRLLRGLATAHLLYPVAETLEKRDVRSKVAELRRHYALSAEQRLGVSKARLVEMLLFAGSNVPYYRDLFARLAFDPEKVAGDPRRLQQLPLLTKDIVREQGERLLSRPLSETRHHACKTGGSTGHKIVVFYDQAAADYSSAVTAFAREKIGATRLQSALHFAARFPDVPRPRLASRETFKCLAMNRSNIFFDRLDAAALDEIWSIIRRRSPYLVHAHPSTMFALASHVRDQDPAPRSERASFDVFESSGEVLDSRQRRTISEVFGCRVVNRYGLAECGVIAYELGDREDALEIMDSECWAENVPAEAADDASRLVVTGLRNRLMPLIRYDTGDLATVATLAGLPVLTNLIGRVHDTIDVNGTPYLTHHFQDVLDHRVQGVRDFQFDMRTNPTTLRLVLEPGTDAAHVEDLIAQHWPQAFAVAVVAPEEMIRVGDRAKFRHVVPA
jgi:phenylacetate-CoA ligase